MDTTATLAARTRRYAQGTEDAIAIVLSLAQWWEVARTPLSPDALIMDNDATIRDWVMAAAVNLNPNL